MAVAMQRLLTKRVCTLMCIPFFRLQEHCQFLLVCGLIKGRIERNRGCVLPILRFLLQLREKLCFRPLLRHKLNVQQIFCTIYFAASPKVCSLFFYICLCAYVELFCPPAGLPFSSSSAIFFKREFHTSVTALFHYIC